MENVPKIQGYRCKQIRSFKRIFEEWIRSTREIAELWEKARDIPWWYTERASLSVFAGAVWRAGGQCFEEFSETKRKIGQRTKRFKGSYSGRVDLYFNWAEFDFIAEAKDTWSGSSQKNGDPTRRLGKCLRRACKDVRLIKPYGQRRLGVVFAMPYFKKGLKTQVNERLDAWVKSLSDLDTSAYAWAFPENTRYFHDSGDDFCPGVAVLIKEVKR